MSNSRYFLAFRQWPPKIVQTARDLPKYHIWTQDSYLVFLAHINIFNKTNFIGYNQLYQSQNINMLEALESYLDIGAWRSLYFVYIIVLWMRQKMYIIMLIFNCASFAAPGYIKSMYVSVYYI